MLGAEKAMGLLKHGEAGFASCIKPPNRKGFFQNGEAPYFVDKDGQDPGRLSSRNKVPCCLQVVMY